MKEWIWQCKPTLIRFWILDFGFWISSFAALKMTLFWIADLGLAIWDFREAV